MTEQTNGVSSSITATKAGDFNRLPGPIIMVQELHYVRWTILRTTRSKRSNPEGCPTVAGGSSETETSG